MESDQVVAMLVLLIPLSWVVVLAVTVAWLRSAFFGSHRAGPPPYAWWIPSAIALMFALLSLPLVAMSINVVDTSHALREGSPSLARSNPGRWVAAASSTLISAAVAGWLGALLVRRHAIAGMVFTFLCALILGIAVLPILPALLGEHSGMVAFCIDGCQAVIDSSDSVSGLRAALFFAWAPWLAPVSVGVLAAGVAVWTAIVRSIEAGSAKS
jgi:hypothetical protein